MLLLRHTSGPAVVRRVSTAAAVTLCVLAGAQLMALPAGASTVPTTGLTLVHVVSKQELPPPYKEGAAFLKTNAAIGAFAATLSADNIGKHLPPTGPGGCTGGTTYTVELTYKTGHKELLRAYECGGAVTGNLTGDDKAFVKYLSTLVR